MNIIPFIRFGGGLLAGGLLFYILTEALLLIDPYFTTNVYLTIILMIFSFAPMIILFNLIANLFVDMRGDTK